jgi:GWxTD domain-containing protein
VRTGVRIRRVPPEVVLALALALACAPPVGADQASARRVERAEQLYAEAQARIRTDTVENRRMAISQLEQATLLVPGDPRYQLALAHAYYRSGFLSNARKRFERIDQLAPGDFDAQLGMGQIWRRDWLKYLDPLSLERAIEHFKSAALARPGDPEPWLQLVPLHVERDELELALAAAENAVTRSGGRPEAQLAHAHVSFRAGRIETAARGFAVAIAGLPRIARQRFEDIAPVASMSDTATLNRLPQAEQAAFVERFWREHDPDFTTPENEAQLEYWSRVAQAYFLYFNPRRGEWDLRGEVYVRYGPPVRADYNPLGRRLSVSFGSVGLFPANVLVWDYPALGMSVTMQDRLLSEHYMLPITMTHDPDPAPDPERIGGAQGLLATRGGRGVFPSLPPGVRELPMASALARFEGEAAPRLLAQVESRGGPGDSLRAAWAVVDSAQRVLLRGSRDLSPSACEPLEFRVADFADALPPGPYTVSLSVRDRDRGRAVTRREVNLLEPGMRLALSDLLVSCGAPLPGRAPRAQSDRSRQRLRPADRILRDLSPASWRGRAVALRVRVYGGVGRAGSARLDPAGAGAAPAAGPDQREPRRDPSGHPAPPVPLGAARGPAGGSLSPERPGSRRGGGYGGRGGGGIRARGARRRSGGGGRWLLKAVKDRPRPSDNPCTDPLSGSLQG